jgi:hypothetical protein
LYNIMNRMVISLEHVTRSYLDVERTASKSTLRHDFVTSASPRRAGELLLGEPCERRVSSVSRETEAEGRNPRQLTKLPHVANRTRAEVSRAVERFAKQQVSGPVLQK